jgi:hypothetical protein
MTWDYVEVVFKNGDEYYTGYAAKGNDVRFTMPEGNYQAVMFAGVVKETRLLAVGVPTSEDGTGTPPDGHGSIEITATTKHITFTLSALSADITSGGSFQLAVGANAAEGTYALDGEDVPYFHVPVDEAGIAGTFRIGGFTVGAVGVPNDADLFNAAGLFGVLDAAGSATIIQAIGTSSYDPFTGKLVPPMKVDGEVNTIGIDGGVLAIGFELATNVNSLTAGFSRMRFDVPIQAFTAGSAAAGRGSVWHIVNGLEAAWDLGGDSVGENILLYTGDTYYVSDDIGSDTYHGMTEANPFKTLQKAAEAAMGNSLCKNIVVLTNLEVPATVAIDATGGVNTNVVTIRGKTSGETVTKANGGNESVIRIAGGAKITFKDITIDGKQTATPTAAWNRGLLVTGAGTAVTLGAGATISGAVAAASDYYGGGVQVADSAWLTISGGKISGSRLGSGVYVTGTDSKVVMKDGEISDNTTTNTNAKSSGGGVYVASGTFEMSGGEISYNTTASSNGGGGVYMASGTFTMSGGKIINNTASYTTSTYITNSRGGGVYVVSGTFTMSDGEIINNTTNSTNGGGGVSVASGTFTMSGGKIINNTTSASTNARTNASGGGVSVVPNPTTAVAKFIMEGGEISGHTRDGVRVASKGEFTMSGGTISGNASGVYVTGDGSKFDMTNGTISGHTVTGVTVENKGVFTMDNGTISGNTAGSGGVLMTWTNPNASGGAGQATGNGGVFIMNNGTISDNVSTSGGGVSVGNGEFTMNNGTISNNKNNGDDGGGVYMFPASLYATLMFTMNGGTISNNTGGGVHGDGGVYVRGLTDKLATKFIMNDGEISDNISGAGVGVDTSGEFEMHGGKISGNGNATAQWGGGVRLGAAEGNLSASVQYATFTMTNGDITGNTARPERSLNNSKLILGGGGGVWMSGDSKLNFNANDNKFTMSGGTISGNIGGGVLGNPGSSIAMSGNAIISGNTGSTYGGGVFLFGDDTSTEHYLLNFSKTGGTIYGKDAGADANAATGDGYGYAIYYQASVAGPGTGDYYLDTTADAGGIAVEADGTTGTFIGLTGPKP